MRILLTTRVDGHYLDVMERFDRKLFEALLPPIGKTEIKEFTGSKTGDLVHLQFISPIKAEWVSDITDHGHNEREAWFVDEGKVLPFGLKYWKHHHIVRKVDEKNSEIIDDISYKASNPILMIILYPLLWLSFFPRRFVYQKYFKHK